MIFKVITPAAIVGGLLNSLLMGPIPEEILFRGTLMTRLSTLLKSSSWGIVISSLIFGLLHVSANIGYLNHAPLTVALAMTLPFDAVAGVAMALLLQRTRNLLAGITLHVSTDTLNLALLPHLIGLFH